MLMMSDVRQEREVDKADESSTRCKDIESARLRKIKYSNRGVSAV